MDVILLTKVANLGNIGDRVKVKSGYGRNFLLPKGKATLATPDNVKKFEARRAELEKIAKDQFKDAESRAAALKDFKLEITAKAGTEGKLFGSIGTADIAEACTKAGHKLARAEVRLPTGPLRTVGEHVVALHLHTDIDVQLPVVITAEDARLKTEE
jgi:large subunit ribosomal protein L9